MTTLASIAWLPLLATLAMLPVVLLLLVAAGILVLGRRSQPGQGDCALVLGSRTSGGRPTPIHLARLNHALELWRAGDVSCLLLTGGVTERGATISEAEAGRQYLVAAGVPPQAIIVEEHARWTSENLRLAAPLLAERSLNRILLVTDPFHMARALLHARRVGIHARPSPVANCPRNTLRFLLEEAVCLLRDAVLPAVQ